MCRRGKGKCESRCGTGGREAGGRGGKEGKGEEGIEAEEGKKVGGRRWRR